MEKLLLQTVAVSLEFFDVGVISRVLNSVLVSLHSTELFFQSEDFQILFLQHRQILLFRINSDLSGLLSALAQLAQNFWLFLLYLLQILLDLLGEDL